MKDVTLFVKADCPYCRQALGFMDELKRERPEFADVNVRKIDEDVEAELAATYDYYYVPTFYVNGRKLHEGVPTKEAVADVFEAASH